MRTYDYENVTGCFMTIINGLNETMAHLEDERREIPADLPIKERREHANDLFDKLEAIDGYKMEVIALKDRLESYLNSLRNINKASDNDDTPSTQNEIADHKAIDYDLSKQTSRNEVDSEIKDSGIREDGSRPQPDGHREDLRGGNTDENNKPNWVIFDEKTYKVENWSDVMVVICEAIISGSPRMVDKLIDSPFNLMEDKKPLFSYHWEIIKSPRKRLSNRLFVRTGLEIEKSPDIYYKIIRHCGYRPDDLKILFSKNDMVDTSETGTGLTDREEHREGMSADHVGKEYLEDPTKLLRWMDKTDQPHGENG